MKRILFSFAILLLANSIFGQNNSGSPYSKYGLGLLPDNYGIYTAMGGVSAAMRDNYNINYLNPASYTALDSLRFYFQVGINAEYVYVSTTKAHTDYTAGQNGAINMAFRVAPKLFASFGFNERTDIGYYYSGNWKNGKPWYFCHSTAATTSKPEPAIRFTISFLP